MMSNSNLPTALGLVAAEQPSLGYTDPADEINELLSERSALRLALENIKHATAPTHDDGGYHEAAYELACAALGVSP